jgi:hypothetical protein
LVKAGHGERKRGREGVRPGERRRGRENWACGPKPRRVRFLYFFFSFPFIFHVLINSKVLNSNETFQNLQNITILFKSP